MDLLEERGGAFNVTRTHRQKLWRIWNRSKLRLICIGMNPSQADETDNDPTAEWTERRAGTRGYAGPLILNMPDVI